MHAGSSCGTNWESAQEGGKADGEDKAYMSGGGRGRGQGRGRG
ncbi:hypothetical protein PC119_g25111 [Phytophthora cactorum]|uniref:Uncharacterized protein n=1 Tax=Phytophthora cactorum TaxID=29920 RepID=A0A8T1AX07_9STRA|nr:hypothetical protein PC117_g24748 [Phytophthora cactorum]KAG2964992.1 hypothetical protein PC119_g25111 [Phytophthora cactorum]